MKNILKKSLVAIAALSTAVGCIEETFPTGSTQTQEQVSKNESAIDAMLNSIPASMMSSATMGYLSAYGDQTDFGIGSIFLKTEHMLEDVAIMGEAPGYDWFFGEALCYSQGSKYIGCAYYWDCYYTWIKTTNDIVSLIDLNTSDPVLQRILGQALAFRGSFYLDLARLYEPKENEYTDISKVKGLTVPIITEKIKESEAKFNPRAPREKMYEFIIDDLQNAARLLKGKPFIYTMPSEAYVNGLLARAYLEKGAAGDPGAYEEAIKYADLVLTNSGRIPLTKAQWEDPKTGFNDGSANSSWILGLTSNSESQINLVTFNAHFCSEAIWGYTRLSHVGVSKALYNRISDKDFRKISWIDPRRDDFYEYKFAGSPQDKENLINGVPGKIEPIMDYQSLKFRPAKGNPLDFTVGNTADQCLMRIEEFYFIKAEALAQLNRVDEAAKVLNELINTRYEDQSYDSSKFAGDKDTFLEELLLQKRIEFWGEGILIYDYKRLDHGITRAYEGSNHAAMMAYNTKRRSPQWNIVITRGEFQSNTAITDDLNNPDPSKFTEPTPFEK